MSIDKSRKIIGSLILQKKNYNPPDVVLPWKICLGIGVIFGCFLISKNNSWPFRLVRWIEFTKLNWTVFGKTSVLFFLLVLLSRRFKIHNTYFALFVSLLFNGVVGGYIGIAILDFWIGAFNDAIEFLGWAWIAYVYFFLTANVVANRKQP